MKVFCVKIMQQQQQYNYGNLAYSHHNKPAQYIYPSGHKSYHLEGNYTASNQNCDIKNCGKLLWVHREPNGTAQDNYQLGIRTNQSGLPYTPQPRQRTNYLANQNAIQAALPLLKNSYTSTYLWLLISLQVNSCFPIQ